MNEDIYRIRLSVESMARLMEELVAQQRKHHQCCRAVELPPDDPAPVPTTSTISGTEVPSASASPHLIPAPDPLAGQLDMVISVGLTAAKLFRSERQVRRYRDDGKLTFVADDGEGRSGFWLSQVRRLYFDFNGKWPMS